MGTCFGGYPNPHRQKVCKVLLRYIFAIAMTSSSFTGLADDRWFQQAAASQIRSEYFQRAERLNGRAAMLGFVIAVLTEAFTGYGILGQLHIG